MGKRKTLLGDLAGWRRERLGRKAVRRLYPILIRRYGKDRSYTSGQIRRALEISRLGRRYRPYAFAVFAGPGEVSKLAPGLKRAVAPLTENSALTTALQFYALSHLQIFAQAADGGDGGGLFGGGDGGAGDGGGAAGGDGGGA